MILLLDRLFVHAEEIPNRILQLGFVYIVMIFVVYFAIGLGLLGMVRLSDEPHFVARVGAWLLIGLAAINLIEHYFPRFPIKLHMPAFAGERARELIAKSSLPATIAAGVLVGLCTFPCSGGIYVAVITLLNAKTTMAWGVGYLALYNVMFVLPLIVILLAAGNRVTAKSLGRLGAAPRARYQALVRAGDGDVRRLHAALGDWMKPAAAAAAGVESRLERRKTMGSKA